MCPSVTAHRLRDAQRARGREQRKKKPEKGAPPGAGYGGRGDGLWGAGQTSISYIFRAKHIIKQRFSKVGFPGPIERGIQGV